ncbi:MAG: DUF4349 domain-containing protein [Spirochaetota bacterium]
MRKKIITGLIIYAGVFVLFSALRLIYSYASGELRYTYNSSGRTYGRAVQQEYQQNAMNAPEGSSGGYSSKRNIATYKKQIKKESADVSFVNIDQKYERVASIASHTSDFDRNEREMRTNIATYNAVVQFEQNSGLKGSRFLSLSIGVLPERFDSMVEDVRKIGTVVSFEVNKFDRTSEFKETSAKRRALLAMHTSLMALKGKGGTVKEFIDLEKQILEVENQIQSLGVTLGDYAEENELCTIKVSFSEVRTARASFVKHCLHALSWSAKTYAAITLIVFFASLSILICAVLVDKSKWIFEKIKHALEKK